MHKTVRLAAETAGRTIPGETWESYCDRGYETDARASDRQAVANARAESAQDWPADLPRPGDGFRYPTIRALTDWLGLENRKFDPRERAQMTGAWATVATERGLIDAPPVRDEKAPEETRRVRTRAAMPGRPEPRPGRVENLGSRAAS